MTATANLTEVRCDGPGYGSCPTREARYSSQYSPAELRDSLARVGWDAEHTGDLVLDRCPNCGTGTA